MLLIPTVADLERLPKYSRYNKPPDYLRTLEGLHLMGITEQELEPVAVYAKYLSRYYYLYDFSQLEQGRDYWPIIKRIPPGCYYKTYLKRKFKLTDEEISALPIIGVKTTVHGTHLLHAYQHTPAAALPKQLTLF